MDVRVKTLDVQVTKSALWKMTLAAITKDKENVDLTQHAKRMETVKEHVPHMYVHQQKCVKWMEILQNV